MSTFCFSTERWRQHEVKRKDSCYEIVGRKIKSNSKVLLRKWLIHVSQQPTYSIDTWAFSQKTQNHTRHHTESRTFISTTLNHFGLWVTRITVQHNQKRKLHVKYLFPFLLLPWSWKRWLKGYLRNLLDGVSDTQLCWIVSNTAFSRLCSLSIQVPTCSLQGLFYLFEHLSFSIPNHGTKKQHRLMTPPGFWQLYGWDLKLVDRLFSFLVGLESQKTRLAMLCFLGESPVRAFSGYFREVRI